MAGISRLRSMMTMDIAAFLLFAVPSAIALPIYTILSLPPGMAAPKMVAFDLLGGGHYTGISGGRIVKYSPPLGLTDFAFTAQTRNVTQATLNRDSPGRLLRFHPTTGQVAVWARGLSGPGSVAGDSSYLLVSELTAPSRSSSSPAPSADTIQSLLNAPRSTRTIRRTPRGEFPLTERVRPFTHRALRINANGTVLANVSIGSPCDEDAVIARVQISGLFAYVGSLHANFVGQVSGLGLL